MRRPSFLPVWPLLPLAICLFPLRATGADAARQCAAESDDRARLACYDGIFGKPPAADRDRSATAASPAAVSGVAGAAGAATAAVPANPEDDFGLTEQAKRARDPEKAQEQVPQSITETVASVRRRPTGELVVTLASGQVWSQIHADTRARVSAGDTVTIKKASLGSYLLVTSSKLATRVRRVE